MPRRDAQDSTVLAAFAASTVVHALIIVPLLIAVMTTGGTSPRVEARFSSEPLRPEQEEPKEREPMLGIEQSRASTLTWIGYDEYVEHLAQFAEVEQAAFTDAPTGSEPMPADDHAPLEEFTESEVQRAEAAMAEAQPGEVDAALESSPEPERIEHEPVEIAAEPEPIQLSEAIEALKLPEIDLADIARMLEIVGLMSRQREATDPKDDAAASEPTEIVQEAEEDRSREQQPAQSAPSSSENEPQQPDAPGEPADSADKQAEATSIVEVTHTNWRLGKPLAAEGVELKPRRPQFSIMQRLTSSPCNPLIEMHFDQRGVTTKATIVESSREKSIDAAIEASVYQWKAEGEAIEQLEDEQTFVVRIRFILNPYARCP